MSSLPHYKLTQCSPSCQRHLWKIVKRNGQGDISKMQCVHCDQTITGIRQCLHRTLVDGLYKEKE